MRITKNHRKKQLAYNAANGIVPKSVRREINESAYVFHSGKKERFPEGAAESPNGEAVIEELRRDMLEAADNLEFERAAYLRDQIKRIQAELKGESK